MFYPSKQTRLWGISNCVCVLAEIWSIVSFVVNSDTNFCTVTYHSSHNQRPVTNVVFPFFPFSPRSCPALPCMLTHPSPAWLDLHLHQSAERRRAQFCKYTVPSYNFEYVQGPHAYNYKAPLWIWYFLFGQSCIFLNDNLWLKCKVDVGWYKMQDKSRTS